MTAPDGAGTTHGRGGRAQSLEADDVTREDVTSILARERRRLADLLHGGVVQDVTALSLAVESALLHRADGDPAALDGALTSLRALADQAIRDCRGLMDDLRTPPDP